ncbi:unnamed protein product [Prorocentrum cordatum]|uniref:NodB homology domain-containing protein n=1 Tax=Prorocentrum cordatum TaxID=2364126 RepID=A0ABN9TNX5_9DINO|nr:unnamed protein product [Polarella glacialis]
MIEEVQSLLDEFEAKATFFLCTDFVPSHVEALRRLVCDGHEVANHCRADRSYAEDEEADFEVAFLEAERVCEEVRAPARRGDGREASAPSNGPAIRWFRAPQGNLSNSMKNVVNRHGFTHVLCDCYANDPWISDAEFIAETMLSLASDGSIAVIHMPERGFREYNLRAMRDFLGGLRSRGFQVVTLSALHRAACSQPRTAVSSAAALAAVAEPAAGGAESESRNRSSGSCGSGSGSTCASASAPPSSSSPSPSAPPSSLQ